jgi:ribosomal protein S18 acetylase RimI-like enzyme
MSEPTVRAATTDEEQRVFGVITLAFAADPMARFFLPGAELYLKVWPRMVRAFGAGAFQNRSADCIENCGGAALWLAPGVAPDGDELTRLTQDHGPADRLKDLEAIFDQMAGYHPHEPHWYLPLIGVDPACQGSGLGSALMRHALARSDRDGLPAYLESSNPRNITLYERHGFKRLGAIQSGTSPTIVPMLREPR